MNLFEELEGRSGEGLGVGALRMLMLRSPGCRNAVIRVIDAVSHVGLIESRSHFSCYAEHPTKDPELGDGRIDLLVEVDAAVIGIEAKFGAGFQADQPNKYQAEVQRLADQLSEARGHRLRRMFLVLAPAVRREEIEHLLGAEARVITWEEVIEALTHAVGLDPVSQVLRDEYVEYLRKRLDFLPEFPRWAHHLTQRWEPRGTEDQHQLLRSVWSVLPDPSSRIGSGDHWVGYYFAPDGADGPRAWIGFISGRRLTEPRPGALLVIAPVSIPDNLPASCRRVQLNPDIWVDGSKKPSVEVLFDGSWVSQQQWREVIERLNM